FLPPDWSALVNGAAQNFQIAMFGSLGGDEVRNAAHFIDEKSRVGTARAKRVFNDHFPLFDPESQTTIPQQEKTYDDPLLHSTRQFSSRQLRVLVTYLSSINAAVGVSCAQS